ncbi:MAG: Ig-like domain-containing protein [Candidatus Poribacteria bacterium]|nr:Ig-like domain-containing protein [Candidatus Poribacteria bacterium]
MITPNVWAALTSMSVDASGDFIFRGGSDRLLITFTVDARTDEDGDPYTVTVIPPTTIGAGEALIAQGTVLPNETVRILWDGSANGQQLPDGEYTIKVVLNKKPDEDEGERAADLEKTAKATLDATSPRISKIEAGEDDEITERITEGKVINTPISFIKVTPDEEGSPIDFGPNLSNIVLKNENGTTVAGSLSHDTSDDTLTLTLENSLDALSENGTYTLEITLFDKARNDSKSQTKFTFDFGDELLRLTSVATNRGRLTPGAYVSQQLSYVEATFADNLDNLGSSNFPDIKLFRIIGSEENEIPGQRTQLSTNRIRLQLLSPLLPTGGLQDGEYEIRIIGDNEGEILLKMRFYYDNLAPELVSLEPVEEPVEADKKFNRIGDTIYHRLPLTQFVVAFNDGSGVRVPRIVFGTPGEDGINALGGRSFPGANSNTLIYILDKPIVSRDGSQDGRYILNVQATDIVGNTKTYNYRFIYDTQLPTLISTTPAANATVSELSQVEVKLNEKTSGIDFIQSSFQLTRNDSGAQVDVPVNITSNGTDTITLTLTEPIALDGSDDGTYRIEITPTDRARNSGPTVVREFYLISQKREPEIRLTIPETTTVNSLTTITAEIVDYIGAGIDFDASTLTVRNSQGAFIAQEDLARAEASNQLTWTAAAPVARDGSADGEYTITATFIDFTGQSFTQEFPLVLDTQFPAIESVQVAAESPTSLAEDRTTDIADSVGQITVAFDETAGDVDFGATVVSLMGPGETVIPVNRVDNGQAVLTLNFQALTQRGEYTLSVTPQDLTGNQSTSPFVYRFRIDVALPVVSSVLIDGKSGTLVYVNGTAANIVANFTDLSGVGVALGDGGSTIVVTSPSGIPAPGITTSTGENQLTWTPIVLPTDGSADGRYTVTVTPIDNAGRQGDVVYRQFVYDTQEPRISAATPLTLNAPVSYVSGGLNQLTFTVADVVPGEGIEPSDILWESQTIELLDASGAAVPAALTYDELASQLYLTLSSPFAQDGSVDGEYTVKLGIVDRSGNLLDAEYTFIYDSQVPSLSSVRVNTEPAVALVPNRITEILESVSSIIFEFDEATRVDFANTQVTLTGPTGETIPLTLEDNGTTGLTVSFLPLVQVGMYTLSVTAQDVAGNVTPGAVDYRFTLDLALPLVSSVLIDGKAGTIVYVNGTAANIVANFAELSGVGVALGDSGSTIAVTSPSGIPAPGITTATGENQLTWSPIVLPTDGSADGRYTVTVTPIDNAGRQGDVVYRQFVYDTQEPRITAATSLTLNAPVSYVSGGLSQFTFTIEDVVPGEGIEPSDILWESQTIALLDASGNMVPTALTFDELSSQLYLTLLSPFAQDGSVDGEYTVELGIVDKAGNRLDVEHAFIYDSQVPGLSSVMINAESPVELVPQQVTEILETTSAITLQFEEATRVDFANTVVTLTGPGEQPIPLNVSIDGFSQLTVRFIELTQAGLYTLSVTPQDIAGNVAQGAVQYTFRLELVLPSVSAVTLGGQTGDMVFLNGSDFTVVATLVDEIGVGLALGEDGSGIVVTNASGSVVPGQLELAENALIWNPVSLPTDGSADGRYSVAITPVDKTGRRGEVVSREFIYDTEAPQITASSPLTLSQPVSYVSGALRQFTFTVADVGPADLVLADQTVILVDAAGDPVSSVVTHDELTNQLYLTLSSPFAQDGSVDGEYTVELGIVDKAGNRSDSAHIFIYDSQVPNLSSVMVNTESPLVLTPEGIVDISESISSITLEFDEATRIDFTNTQVTLTGPGGEAIPLTLEDNGTTGLTASFLPLRQIGVYTLSVTAQDVAGNVASGAVNYRFALDLTLPSVISVMIGGKSGDVVFINGSDTRIVATFSDDTRISLTGEGSSIIVTDASGAAVRGQMRVEGKNQLIWQALSLPADGSVDGRYTVEITPINKAGRRGEVVSREFIYDTEAPQITASSPLTLSQPVSYVSGALRQFTFTVADVGPADLVLADQTVILVDAAGDPVSSVVTHDELTNQLYLTLSSPFAQDGSVDGEYTVELGIVDKAGNRSDSAHTFVYDSQVPGLSSVLINAESPVELVPQQVTEISETTSAITLQFEEAIRVDFANTVVTLAGPDEQPIVLNVSVDGFSQLTVRFIELTQAGLYTLSVTPQDIAGNVAQGAVQYTFRLELVLPSVSAVTLGGQTGDMVFLNGSDSTIVATLVDEIGVGLASGEGGSSIVVTNASGSVVPGQLRLAENALIWNPISLPTDGSADGRYSVAITPVDKTGRRGEVVSREFIYDTEAPQITASSPLTLSQPVSYVSGALRQFTFTVADVGPADLVLADQTVILVDAAGDPVSSVVTHDELTNQLYLTLSSPFAQDGSVDGEYTVELGIVDKAGNRSDSAHTFIYDSQVPHLSSVMVNTDPPVELVPNRIAEILASLSSITLKFDEATRIDFTNTQITLMGPDPSGATDDSGVPIESEFPLTLQDDGASQVTVNFLKLEQIGSYKLSITPRDVAGNAASGPVAYHFFLDIPLPRVTSIVIGESETTESGDVAYVNASNMIIGAFLVDPTETGLSFGTEGSSITVVDVNNTIVRGATGSNGENLIVWEPIGLTSDGTTDGRYSVYVIPVDQAGRQGSTIYREFVYDTQEPEIIAADPIDLSQPVSYISRSLTQLRFTVADVGPADLMLSDQQVSLRDASGGLVPAQLTNDTENQLFLTLDQPLPLDGSMDGEYTVLIALADKAGNPYTVEHSIIYDTQSPTLVSTVPADGALLTEDVTEIQVTLNDEGGSRIDWAMTTVILVDPNGTQISGELVSDGETKLTLTTNQLVADGRYIIRVQAVDRAGNGNATVFERSFLLSRRLPTVVSTEPTTAPRDEAFTNEELEGIEVRLETDDENHLSTLRLLNADNQVIAGQQRRTSTRLIYDLVRPLATDGSEDGVYTIEFTPISASGRSGGVQRFTFTYDTQSPEIETDEVINLVVVQPEVNNSLTEIRVNLTDETSGIDWKNLDEKWLTFERLSPNPTKISGRVSDDGQGNLTFRLTVPLADNGSADGEYKITINPKDRAGNDDEPYQKVFVYDTNPPTIDESTLLINELPLLVDINAVDYPTAVSTTGGVVIQANIFDTGLGVNLAQSRITVRGPDGSEISGSTQQNGVDTLIFKSDGLTVQGVYKITVISVGNDSELLGFAPTDSITAEFLYETTEPTAAITSDGGETELTDKALPLEGTASDPAGTQRVGEGEIPVPASGVWLVEIVGTGPDNQPIEPVAAVDDSDAEQEPWSVWSIDFLPTRSGEYDLDVRVTDNAGNYAIYDIGTYTMSVSLTFRGTTFGWPNPLRLSKRDVAFFSFDVNVPLGDTIELTLSIYDWSGDMVLSQTYPDVVSGQRNDQLVKWNLENQAGTPVARGLYIFRLEAVNAAGNRANVVGKVLVVE